MAKDRAGNVSSTAIDEIALDTLAPSGTMAIDGGAVYTDSSTATVGSAMTGAHQMRLRNASGTWSGWMTYAAARGWMLPIGDGTKFVGAQYRDRAGNLLSRADSIVLDCSPTLGVSASAPLVAHGSPVRLTGSLVTSAGPVRRATVTVWSRPNTSSVWIKTTTARYDAVSSKYVATCTCGANAMFQMRFAAQAQYRPAVSGNVSVLCGAYLPASWLVPATPTHGVNYAIYGLLGPRHSGSTRIYFWRKTSSGAWASIGFRDATNAPYHGVTRYRLVHRLPTAGKYRIRAYHGDGDHAPTSSPWRYFTVR